MRTTAYIEYFDVTFSAMVMFYIRYKQISTYQTEIDRPERVLTNVNKAALGAGLLSAFGISVVGNFQVKNKNQQ